jgi:hypothetical protein
MSNLSVLFEKLPNEVISYIREFMPHEKLIFTNKKNYEQYHYLLKEKHLIKNYYFSYVREMVRYDRSFVFKKILEENKNAWLIHKNYYYKNMVFVNYIYFILYYCNENSSTQCRELIVDLLKKRNLYKNIHKKIVFKYINGNFRT